MLGMLFPRVAARLVAAANFNPDIDKVGKLHPFPHLHAQRLLEV